MVGRGHCGRARLLQRQGLIKEILGRELLGDEPGETGGIPRHEPPAQGQSLDIAEDVCPPRRMQEELDLFRSPRPSGKGPMGYLFCNGVGICLVLPKSKCGVRPDPAESLSSLPDDRDDVGVK